MIWPYINNLLIFICIYTILAVGLNIALGYTGLLNLGHVAFFGIGAYTSAILTKAGFPFVLAFLLAGIFASIFGFILVLVTRKLKGDYLALATLGFNYVIFSLMVNWTELTRGPLGIAGIQKPSFLGWTIGANEVYLLFAAGVCIFMVLFAYLIVKSPFGRLLQATRDDEIGLRVLGKNTFMLKAKAMTISAFFAGIAGSVYAHYITFISPNSFSLPQIIFIFTIVIVGGLASLKGSFIGTCIIFILPEALRFLELPSSVLGPLRQMIYALILILILIFRPRGIFGRIDLNA